MFTENTQKPTDSEHIILWTHKGAVKKFSGKISNMPENQQLATSLIQTIFLTFALSKFMVQIFNPGIQSIYLNQPTRLHF